MKHPITKLCAVLLALVLTVGIFTPAVCAAETDEAVADVIAQLEAIDTLQQMQDKRSSYTAGNKHYDVTTTDSAIIEAHNTARTGYESYVSTMFAARIAAQQAYDALTDAQKAQIDSALVDKLSNDLSTVFAGGTYAVTPSDNEYTFETVNGGLGYAYEVGNHMITGEIPQTFILVDTSDGKTSWTPSGIYEYGNSNYDVAYCCDVETVLKYETDYKRVNLEDSNYYGTSSAQHIRAILLNSYPYLTVEEMKANLKAGGLDADFVDSLTRADLISAVQAAIWTYANVEDNETSLSYFATINVQKNTGKDYFTVLHDYTNECWDWLPGAKQRTYDARAEYRVNNLAYYLCNLPGVAAEDDEIVISDVEVTRADLIAGSANTYNVGLYIHLNEGGGTNDNLKITVTSYSADGVQTGRTSQPVGAETEYGMYVTAKYGDTIEVVVEGTQDLGRGVYFYEPEGGRGASQSLVGVAEGETAVRAEETFTFEQDIEMGLRIYKTAADTGSPISDITFHVYNVPLGDGNTISEKPTDDEIEKYATAENLIDSVTTDATGYAALALEEGTYLVVEEHNKDKVKNPVDPFYIQIPMTETSTSEDGTTTTEIVDIVSVYPKNEPVIPPEEPPVIPPPPGNVTGKFEILKYDAADNTKVLSGAQFAVYRAATAEDNDTTIITCDGVQYAVVPVMVNGAPLVLTTDANGKATSPELACGTYFLVEVEAPDGYNLLDEAVTVTVVSSTMTSVPTVEIANRRGSILPETGGSGTTWMLTLGGAMTLCAVVLLVTKRRMQRPE